MPSGWIELWRTACDEYLGKSEGGAGSRGGKVIGRTPSGKPVYAPSHEKYKNIKHVSRGDEHHSDNGYTAHMGHKSFTHQDHFAAGGIHMYAGHDALHAKNPSQAQKHFAVGNAHYAAAAEKKESPHNWTEPWHGSGGEKRGKKRA